MISRLVSFALSQRFVIVAGSLMLMIWGAISFERLPIDAYPDLSPTHVEIITQWPGHASEEIERQVTMDRGQDHLHTIVVPNRRSARFESLQAVFG